MSGLVYDTGALIAAERDDRRLWALHARALARGVLPVVPATVVAEAWRGGRQPSLARLLHGCQLEPLDAERAKRSGRLLNTVSVGVTDATVVEAATRHRAAVVTSDRADVIRLAAAARRRLAVIDV